MIPERVTHAMYLASWAHAEDCPVIVTDERGLGLYVYEHPSDELAEAFSRGSADLVGALAWAVPIRRPKQRGGLTFANWPATHRGLGDARGRN